MPNKSKNQKKRGGAKSQEGSALMSRIRNDDDESMIDNMSVHSVLSDDSSLPGSDPPLTGEESSEDTEQENFEDMFLEYLDRLLAKSTPSRTIGLSGLRELMQKKYAAEFITGRKETLTDSLVRCIRRGKEEEQAIASKCMSLLAIHLGPEVEDQFLSAQPFLLTMLADNSIMTISRIACANALAVCSFLCCNDLESWKSVSKGLEDIFTLGYGKGENSPTVTVDQSWLISEALSAWSLLLTIAPQYEIQAQITKHLGSLQDLLQNSFLDLRMTTGETIALLYELAREVDEDFEHEDEEELCESLKQLATDSVKHRAKKDRRQQRSCFRDVQRYIVDGEGISETLKIGKENLEISSWAQKKQYDALCGVLKTGMSAHMRVNPLVRDIFGLGPPSLEEYNPTKSLTKSQRSFVNAAAFKARTKVRAKQRDKRSVMANGF